MKARLAAFRFVPFPNRPHRKAVEEVATPLSAFPAPS
jgi:hypothetical protein